MKSFLVILTLVAFMAAVPLAFAQSDAPKPVKEGGEKAQTINCCNQGKCSPVKAEADCTKAGGKVVKDCKDCK